MSKRIAVTSVVVPPGRYWLGDPCYSVPDDKWMPLLESSDYLRRPGEVDGMLVVAFSTAYGDGCYRGSDGFEYGVDAGIGMIGLVDARIANPPPRDDLARLVEFANPTKCYVEGGTLVFGNVTIETGDEDEDEDEDEDDYYDDDEDEDPAHSDSAFDE